MLAMNDPRYRYRPWDEKRKKEASDRMKSVQHWTDKEKATLKRLRADGKTFTQIGKIIGRTRNSCIGAWNRLEEAATKEARAERATLVRDGYGIVPAKMIAESVAGTIGCNEGPDFEAAMVCVAPMFVGTKAIDISIWCGVNVHKVIEYSEILHANGIWRNGRLVDHERYTRDGDKPGFQMSDMNLVLDTMLCLGVVRKTKDDRWFLPTAP